MITLPPAERVRRRPALIFGDDGLEGSKRVFKELFKILLSTTIEAVHFRDNYLLALPLRFYIHSGSLSLCCAARWLAIPNRVIKLLLSAVNPHGEQITPALLNRHMKTQAVREQSGFLLPDRFSIYSYLPDALFSFFSACAFSIAFRFLKSL